MNTPLEIRAAISISPHDLIGMGQDLGVQDQNVGDGNEGGDTGQYFCPNGGLAFTELEIGVQPSGNSFHGKSLLSF